MTEKVHIHVNAPALGSRIDHENDVDYFEFDVADAGDHTIEITPGGLLGTVVHNSGACIAIYGPDNDFGAPIYTQSQVGGVNQTLSLAVGRYTMRVWAFDVAGATDPEIGAYTVRVTDDNRVITIPASPGGSVTVNGNIEYDGDNDWFEFVLTGNTDLTISTINHAATLPGGCRIYLYDNDGARHELPLNGEIVQYNPSPV